MQKNEFIKENIKEAKKRIRSSILKDNLIIFFTRVLEDLKNEESPNLFGRVKDLYVLINPYSDYYEHEIFRFFNSDFSCDKGLVLDDVEFSYVKIFFSELKRDFHLKNPKVMKGRINGILTKLCERYLTESSKLIEPFILGRLISAVGGIERFYKMPSSTIQLIGAEVALFRHISKKAKCPKYGILYYSKYVQGEKEKGKMARKIANKISINIKVDYFKNFRKDLE